MKVAIYILLIMTILLSTSGFITSSITVEERKGFVTILLVTLGYLIFFYLVVNGYIVLK